MDDILFPIKPNPSRHYTDEQITEARKLYREGYPIPSISILVKMEKQMIRYWCVSGEKEKKTLHSKKNGKKKADKKRRKKNNLLRHRKYNRERYHKLKKEKTTE